MDTLGTDKHTVEENIMRETDKKTIHHLLTELPEAERLLIQYRYGIGESRLRQNEVADKLNISQSYVSRIEKRILQKLKDQYLCVV